MIELSLFLSNKKERLVMCVFCGETKDLSHFWTWKNDKGKCKECEKYVTSYPSNVTMIEDWEG